MTDFQSHIHLQNEIISGVLIDMDKMRSMILEIHKEQKYIKKMFLHPQPPPQPRVEAARPVSVPTKLPSIVPRPPTAKRPPSGRVPRQYRQLEQPIMVF